MKDTYGAEISDINSNVWNGYDSAKIAVTFESGDGSALSPYIITNGDQLYRMIHDSGLSANKQATYYKLGADIYLNDITNYEKWGSKNFDMSTLNNWMENETYFSKFYDSKLTPTSYSFRGNFDGDGYYKITCLDCGNKYNSLDDDYDCFG